MRGDDFGDLYADVEAQASSVINSIQNCASVYAELPQEEDADYGNAEKLNEGSLLESDSKKVPSENLGNLEAYGSDSEDDLNIVLNDEDCEGFVVGSGRNGSEENQYDDPDPDHDVEECLGKNGSDKSGFNPNGNGSGGGNRVKNDSLRYSQYKHVQPYGSSFPSNRKGNESWVGSCSSQSVSGNWEVNMGKQQRLLNSLVSHGRHGFSLPWYRTILDINIDAFKEKPWCYPGVDLSDFFNFGFDEDSWKQYCISAEKIRQQSYIHSRKAIHGLPKVAQTYEVGYEHERIAEEGESSAKAAEMGEGHLKLPKGRAIQVEDSSGDRQPTINLRCPHDWDSDVVIQVNVQDSDDNCSVSCEEGNIRITKDKPLLSKDLNTDDMRDNHYSGSGSKNEMSAGSSQGNVRYSQLISESDQMSLDLDNHDDDHVQISKKDVPEALDTVEMAVEESGRNISKSDQCIIESELSLDDRSHFSPTISYSASDVGTSRDGNYGLCEDSPHPLRTPGPQLQDSGASNTKDNRNTGITNKPGTSQNCMRERSSIWEGRKYLDRNPSPTPRGHSSVDRGRHIGRMDDDYRNAEEFSYHRKRDFSSGYNNEMFADRHFCSGYTKHSRRRYSKSTRDETKPQDRRDWNDREHFHRKCFPSGKQNDQYDRRRGFCLVGTFPSINWKSRRSVSAYNFKARDVQWRREGEKILSGKRFNRERYLFDKTNDDFIKERRRRFNSFENRRRHSFDGKHRSGGASAGRESFILGKRFRCDDDPSMGLDRLWCMEIDDEYPNHHQYIHPRSHRESYAINEGRWQDRRSPRIGMFESRFAGRHRRQIYNVEDRNSGWVGRYNDSGSSVDGIVYPDSDVELTRRNYGSQSCVMHETQYESLVRHQDDGLYVDSISCSSRVIPRNDEIRGNHRYKEEEEEEEEEEEGMVVGDMNFERHRHKMIGEEIEVKLVDKNSNLIYGDEHGQMAWRCLGPLDLIAEEEKSPGKQSDGGSMLCNGKLEMMDLNFVEDQTNMKNFEETGIYTDMLMNEGDHDDLKWLDKFPVTEHNAVLDIEDGQITTEDPNIEDSLENIYVPDSAAPNHNMEKNIYCETASREDANGGYDDQRILDTMAKMEKRRERFKDTITLKTDPDQNPMAQVDSAIDPVETKMERPTRKRRWGGG